VSNILVRRYQRLAVWVVGLSVILIIITGIIGNPQELLLVRWAGTDKVEASVLQSASQHRHYLPLVTDFRLAYFDGFDDPTSGWYVGPAVRYNNWCREDVGCFSRYEKVAYMNYVNVDGGKYRFYVPMTWHGGEGMGDTWFVWPAQAAPLPDHYYPLPENFCIEARGAFVNYVGDDMQPYWAHWGIVFGASENMSQLYTAQVNANRDYAILRFRNYVYPGNRQPFDGSDVNVEIPLQPWTGVPNDMLGTHVWNTLRVVVQQDRVFYYINGRAAGSADVSRMPRERIGLIGGSWELTPVDILIDYFRYEPNCTG
jgi:hypothetical protein